MPIKYNKENKVFKITTAHTQYIMRVAHDKYLLHIFYGSKSIVPDLYPIMPRVAHSPQIDGLNPPFSPNMESFEFPCFGNGDFRTDAFRIRNINGDDTTKFMYQSYKIFNGRRNICGLPFANAKDEVQTLEITLKDEITQCLLKQYYTVFYDDDIIIRHYILENQGTDKVILKKGMSFSLDIPGTEWDIISLHGKWNNERNIERYRVTHGISTLCSTRGASSHTLNPFFMLVAKGATEERGDAYGFNLAYSGSFLATIELPANDIVRIQEGLNPDNFEWTLYNGDVFYSPEAVLSYSSKGMGQVSRNFHSIIRKYYTRPCNLPHHPVVLNTWEGNYFNIDEKKMLEYADQTARTGIDMLVMDDGWFGKRRNDNAGLGDWYASPELFPSGLEAFVNNIKKRNIKFGIWIEPEMVNLDSDLYRAHPEWIIQSKRRDTTPCRHQFVLDMSNPDVIEYLKESFSKVFHNIDIDYIKWDCNRSLSEVGSTNLPPERQKEAWHRHILGVYELFRWFEEKFPNVMIENCSGGGGRYDLGMMKYSSQIWASDNTEPKDRTLIQYGSLMGYPASVMSCHVSNHSRAIENPRSLEYRFHVASQGMFGYEFDFRTISEQAKEGIKKQVQTYKTFCHLVEDGDLYRLLNPFETGTSALYYANKDGSEILLSYIHVEGKPKTHKLKIKVADKNATYIDKLSGKEYSGQELCSGISVISDGEKEFSQLFYFVKS